MSDSISTKSTFTKDSSVQQKYCCCLWTALRWPICNRWYLTSGSALNASHFLVLSLHMNYPVWAKFEWIVQMSTCILILLCFPFTPNSSFCQHIDQIMSSHGKQIMQAVTLILEAEHSIEVKEQVSVRLLHTYRWFFFFPPKFSVLLRGRAV